jgi:Winged helix DNA-binding domain
MDPTWAAVLSRRLARHFLTEPATSAADVAAAVCGVHAQIITAAELSIGQRLAGTGRDDVRAALWETRELVKTFGPRGTVHLLPTRDLPRWTGALAAVPRPLPSFDPSVRLAPAQLDEVVAGIGAALAAAEDTGLTIDELDAALADQVGAWAVERCMPAFQELWPRWRQAVDTAANRGVLCFGPVRARKVTYTSPQRWSPGFTPAAGPAAVTWLTRSYLRSYGPARPEHFAQWLSVSRPWAAGWFETLAAAGEIEPVGEPGWVVAGDTTFPSEAPRGLRLLPYFDAYVVGSHPRSRVFPGAAAIRALARTQAGNFPVLLLDGVVGGVWHQKRAGRYLDLTVEPLEDLPAARRRALDAEVDRVAAFQELTPRLTIGPVSVGPHA